MELLIRLREWAAEGGDGVSDPDPADRLGSLARPTRFSGDVLAWLHENGVGPPE